MKKRVFISFSSLLLLLVFATSVQAESNRLSGIDRYETAVKISQEGWGKAQTVILAIGDNFPDALAGGPLAYQLNAPILLTKKNELGTITKSEIQRLGVKNAIILGGKGVISKSVEKELASLDVKAERIGGIDRYETASLIEVKLKPTDKAIIVFGGNYPDALAVAPYAARNGYPILLSQTKSLPKVTLKKLAGKKEVFFIGGKSILDESLLSIVKNSNPKRISGIDPYSTATEIAIQLPLGEGTYIATGQGFADSLTGSVLAAKRNASLLLVESFKIPVSIQSLLKDKFSEVTILGGEKAVSKKVESNITKGKGPVKEKPGSSGNQIQNKDEHEKENPDTDVTDSGDNKETETPKTGESEPGTVQGPNTQNPINGDEDTETNESFKTVQESLSDFEVDGIAIGDNEKTVIDKLGQPQRKDLGVYGQEWYVYNQAYKKYFQVAILDGKVVGLFTNTNSVLSNVGIKIGQTKKQVSDLLGNQGPLTGKTFTPYYDEIKGGVVHAILLESNKLYTNSLVTSDPIKVERLRDGYEKTIFDLTNSFRVQNALTPYILDNNAQITARLHSTDMVMNAYFDHTNLQGKSPFQRMIDRGISFSGAAENIAAGQPTPFDVHDAWLNSQGHRSNMLSYLERLGVGVAFSTEGSHLLPYYTQNFYTPSKGIF